MPGYLVCYSVCQSVCLLGGLFCGLFSGEVLRKTSTRNIVIDMASCRQVLE